MYKMNDSVPESRLISGNQKSMLELLIYLEQANDVALLKDPDEIEDQTLALIMAVCQARAGMLYLYDRGTHDLVCTIIRQGGACQDASYRRGHANQGLVGLAFSKHKPILTEQVAAEPRWNEVLDGLRDEPSTSAITFPLMLGKKALGVIQVLDPDIGASLSPETNPEVWVSVEMVQAVANRLAPDIERAIELVAAQEGTVRMEKLIAIFEQIGATLDRDQILSMMLHYAREVINAEASSLFLVDEEKGDIVLHLSTNNMGRLRVPAGKGIIGHVISTGETVLVPDVRHDERHYSGVDQSAGFVTRAILAVPLRSRQVVLGGERGIIQERVIGGFEAVNKLEGTFDSEDARVLSTLANQAATVLEIAGLYADANQLFFDAIKALAEAIDAKDPYTEGHSQRVSEYSTEIARELGLPADVINRIRIGSLLHDVGKIGVPDNILSKPGRLTADEYEVMKIHPSIGEKIMSQVRMLHDELPALSQHHERLDGRGYPHGLKKDEISLAGQIVAVADVFDALTSDRPYRTSVSVAEALAYLSEGIDKQFSGLCVNALSSAYSKGRIKTQKERDQLV